MSKMLYYQRLNPEADFNALTASKLIMWLDRNAAGYSNEKVDQINCKILIIRVDKDHLLASKNVADLQTI
jgi:hypothetical protein